MSRKRCQGSLYAHELKVAMLDEEQEKRKKRSGRAILSVSQEVCGPFHSGLPRFSWFGTRNDGWMKGRVLQKGIGIDHKYLTKGNPKTCDHLLSRRRPTSSYESTYLSHPQSCNKSTNSLSLCKWQGSIVKLHKLSRFKRTTSCSSQPRDKAKTIGKWHSRNWRIDP